MINIKQRVLKLEVQQGLNMLEIDLIKEGHGMEYLKSISIKRPTGFKTTNFVLLANAQIILRETKENADLLAKFNGNYSKEFIKVFCGDIQGDIFRKALSCFELRIYNYKTTTRKDYLQIILVGQ